VIVSDALKKDFRYYIKQHGAMLAKGRLLGIQFMTLFADGLYFRISQHAIDMAMRIKNGLKETGIELYSESGTNQQFVVIEKDMYDRLSRDFLLSLWSETDDGRYVVRICTSWATTEENVNKLLNAFKKN
jgi:threonine aldolase